MENQTKPIQVGDENFAKLMQEVTEVFRKYNPPLDVAITGIFYVVSEVGQKNRISKETLQTALAQVYDNVSDILAKEKEDLNEIQH